MIDNEADFSFLDAPGEEQAAVKFRPKQRVKPRKTTVQSKSAAPNPAVENRDGKGEPLTYSGSKTADDRAGSQGVLDTPSENVTTVPLGPLNNHDASFVDKVSLDDDNSNSSSKLASLQTQQESSVVSGIHALPASSGGNNIDDSVDIVEMLDAQAKEERAPKFQPKVQVKLIKATSKSQKTNQKEAGSTVGAATQNGGGDSDQTGVDDDQVHHPKCHESGKKPHSEALLESDTGKSAGSSFKSQPNGGRQRAKEKAVSFALPDVSEGVAPTDTNSEMGTFSNDNLTDENLNTLRERIFEKEYTDNQCQYHDDEPSHHAVEQQSKADDGEIRSSMKLRSRKVLPNVGIPKHPFDDFLGGDCVENSVAELDNDSDDNYTANVKQKVRRKSRASIEEPQQQKVQKDKSQASSRGRKRTSNDASTEKTEKKLTHRIRQKRMKEVKTLLEMPNTEIEHMKLTAAHLRLLQEARERVNGKQNPSGPLSNASAQLEDPDEEAENFDNNRAETDVQNATKLNYHSYMNRQSRARWSKSDTELFYQGLRQFGSDFAMIQQLFPDKTRHQVRQKFKTEEKKNPMLVHDAIIHRSGDNLYFKKVIKQLNIDDMVPEISNTHKQDGASHEGHPGNEDAFDDLFNEEENGPNLLDKEHDMQMSDAQAEEHVSGNDNDDGDDLGAVFDWC